MGRVSLLWWMLWWYYFQIRVKVSVHLCALFIRFCIKVDLILRFIYLSIYWDCLDLRYFRLKYCWMMIFTNSLYFIWISHISINRMANLSIRKRRLFWIFCSVSMNVSISFAFPSLLRSWFLNGSQMSTLFAHLFRFFFSNYSYRFRQFHLFLSWIIQILIYFRLLISKWILS